MVLDLEKRGHIHSRACSVLMCDSHPWGPSQADGTPAAAGDEDPPQGVYGASNLYPHGAGANKLASGHSEAGTGTCPLLLPHPWEAEARLEGSRVWRSAVTPPRKAHAGPHPSPGCHMGK